MTSVGEALGPKDIVMLKLTLDNKGVALDLGKDENNSIGVKMTYDAFHSADSIAAGLRSLVELYNLQAKK